MTPFEKFVGDARRSWSGFVRCVREVVGYFFVRNPGKLAGGEGVWVRGVGVRDWLRDCWEKPIRQHLAEVCVRCGKGTI